MWPVLTRRAAAAGWAEPLPAHIMAIPAPKIDSFTSHFFRGGEESRRLVVVLHGRGDSLEGFLWLPGAISLSRLNYLSINAPLEALGGYAWYPLEPDPAPDILRGRAKLLRLFAELEAQRGRRRSREAYERRLADPEKRQRCICEINERVRLGHQREIAGEARRVAAGLPRVTVRALVGALNAAHVPTLHGGRWHKESAARLIRELGLRA